MVTAVLAWSAVLAVCVAAVLFGQTARTVPRGARSRSRTGRAGLFLSLSGPWLAVLLGAGAGFLTGAWILAAAGAATGVVVTAVAGLILAPH